jgi:hypothetical protein
MKDRLPNADIFRDEPGLIIDRFGGPHWQKALRAEFSRRLARSGSEARTTASRENGNKGGRPKKRPA